MSALNVFQPGDRVEGVDVYTGMLGTVTEVDTLNEVIWVKLDTRVTDGLVLFDPWELKKLGEGYGDPGFTPARREDEAA